MTAPTRRRSTTRNRVAPMVTGMALHRVYNSGSDAVVTGDDGSLWEAGEARYLPIEADGWLDRAVNAGLLVDLGEQEPPAPAPVEPLLPVPPETTESEGTV